MFCCSSFFRSYWSLSCNVFVFILLIRSIGVSGATREYSSCDMGFEVFFVCYMFTFISLNIGEMMDMHVQHCLIIMLMRSKA